MAIKLEKKIVGYSVVKDEELPVADKEFDAAQSGSNIIHMHERLERPEMLLGSTYKVKTPLTEHALYVTINDIILNQDTEYELRRPFEIFINSKNMDHFQWMLPFWSRSYARYLILAAGTSKRVASLCHHWWQRLVT